MFRVDDDLVKEMASAPLDRAAQYGAMYLERLGPIGFWLLRREILETCVDDDRLSPDLRRPLPEFLAEPKVPDTLGACNVLFVLKESSRISASALRPSFVLPLEWQTGMPDSEALPKCLKDLAARVRQDLTPSIKGQWGLRLNPQAGLQTTDLSDVTLEAASGWVPLAGGLVLADAAGRPRSDVFATGAWKSDIGILDVEGIEKKIGVAREFGCRVFFASASRSQDRSALKPPAGMEVRFFPVRITDPKDALHGFLHELEYPPRFEEGSSFEACCRYADGIASREAREDYILENVTEQQAERIIAKRGWLRGRFNSVALLMSSPSAALLSLLVLEPEHALVMFTERDAPAFPKVEARVPDGCSLDSDEVKVDSFEEIREQVLRFLREAGESAAVDVTGGTKGMTAAAVLAACDAKAAVFHVGSAHTGYQHHAGTEDLLFVTSAPSTA
jgi:hypothetical protein